MKTILIIFFILFFNSIYGDESKRFHQQGKIDDFGRKYFLKWNGEIKFKVDSSYFAVFPIFKFIHLHDIEAGELENSGKIFESIALRKNINVCLDLVSPEEKTIFDSTVLNNNRSIGRIISNFQNRLKSREHLLDPNYCIKDENVFFNSSDFSLKGEIPRNYFQDKFFDLKVKHGSNLESSWRVNVFNEITDSYEPNIELENALEIWENMEKNKIKKNASITLAFSRHPLDILSSEFLENYWDFKRGLTDNQKIVLQFIRKQTGIIKETEYIQRDGINTKAFIGYEIYLYSKRTGVSIFYNFPKENKEKNDLVWEKFKDSLYYRGSKLIVK
jgi:hypothetical protein